jgi:hypothetical protein
MPADGRQAPRGAEGQSTRNYLGDRSGRPDAVLRIPARRDRRPLPDSDTLSRPTHLLFQADRRQPTKLRSFIDLVVKEIGLKNLDV